MSLLPLAVIAAPASAQTTTPDALPAAFIAAWNGHDLAAFERIYTLDATWVPVAEELTKGRPAILSEFAKIHTDGGWAVRTTIAMKGEATVRLLRPDIAVIYFHMDFIADGKPVPGVQRALILVAQKGADGWRIAAGQLTKQS